MGRYGISFLSTTSNNVHQVSIRQASALHCTQVNQVFAFPSALQSPCNAARSRTRGLSSSCKHSSSPAIGCCANKNRSWTREPQGRVCALLSTEPCDRAEQRATRRVGCRRLAAFVLITSSHAARKGGVAANRARDYSSTLIAGTAVDEVRRALSVCVVLAIVRRAGWHRGTTWRARGR